MKPNLSPQVFLENSSVISNTNNNGNNVILDQSAYSMLKVEQGLKK